MSVKGQKRTFLRSVAMSAIHPKADIDERDVMSALCHDRKWLGLFNHFVGTEEQRGRDSEAERFGSLEIDRKPEARWLLKR